MARKDSKTFGLEGRTPRRMPVRLTETAQVEAGGPSRRKIPPEPKKSLLAATGFTRQSVGEGEPGLLDCRRRSVLGIQRPAWKGKGLGGIRNRRHTLSTTPLSRMA